jgi:hypothetical protein
VKCEAHRHILQPCLGSGTIRGTKELEKFNLLKFTVNATCNGQCMRWNLSGCRRPGLVSVQSADQSLGHVLEGSHHPNHIAYRYLPLSKNFLASLVVRPLRRGCYWRRHASSLAPRCLPPRRPLTMITCTHTINSINNSIINLIMSTKVVENPKPQVEPALIPYVTTSSLRQQL